MLLLYKIISFRYKTTAPKIVYYFINVDMLTQRL